MHQLGCRHHHSAAPFATASAEDHYAADLRIEPIHMRLDLRVDVPGATLSGTNTLTLRGNGGTGTELVLHAEAFTGVDVHAIDGAVRGWSYDGSELRITLDAPLAHGETAQIVVSYSVSDPVSGLYFSSPTPDAPDAPVFAATDNESERARYWMPCVDLPAVRPTLTIALRVANGLTALAVGRHVADHPQDDGTTIVEWHLDRPCPSYLTCFVVGDLVCATDEPVGDLPVAYYTTREYTEEHLRRSFGRTPDMLRWITAKLARPYPFPKYFQAALPDIGGAMENISLVTWDDMFVLDEKLADEWARVVDTVNIHEMAHSYFGDLVVCRDFAHAWLKESWATYIEACWLEDSAGVDERDYYLYAAAGTYFAEADARYARPIVTRRFDSSWQLYDAHLYPGGACRLHTLRSLIGDEPFWRATRLYVDRFAGKTVETDDFRRTFEESTGRSLAAFFDQWFHRPGYPQLRATFRYDTKQQTGTFEIEQQQESAARGIGLFDLDLTLAWSVDGRVHTRKVSVHNRKHTFAFSMDADPAQVRIDPHLQVLHTLDFNPGDDKLVAQLAQAPDVVGRIVAARELVRTGKPTNIAHVERRYVAETFWGVRVEMARALADANSRAAARALAHAVSIESHPAALESVFTAAGAMREEVLADALRARLDGDLPYRARRAALLALGAQRRPEDRATLIAASAERTYHGLVESGAIVGLARTADPTVLDTILASTLPAGVSLRQARSTVAAIATAARDAGEPYRQRAVDHLVDLLRAPSERVRIAAAQALGSMGATHAAGAIRAAARAMAHQHGVTLSRVADGLVDSAGAERAARAEELASLHAKLRKTEDALDALRARFDAHVEPGDAGEPAPSGGASDSSAAAERTDRAEEPASATKEGRRKKKRSRS
ncbi:MAG: M1 family metallopeptidase [Myxococcales bacterium]|nr:M1 family metallopeptidase [Myxococcales bacterium]MCB9520775.1 M1 family metallopeptidase [Myxococcales bacterium]MCB9532481.1 M1 family metallopeptidase [Myxococcales bacterium]MCB9533492.1 M1 family metallopeptidase [Myxococcales bacterium]